MMHDSSTTKLENPGLPFSVEEASLATTTAICKILADAAIPSAVVGAVAAACYGGGLCPLDIELVVNDSDQERAFITLCSHSIIPALPDGLDAQQPIDFFEWQQTSASFCFRDRRRARLKTPTYQLPRGGNSRDNIGLPFIILYSNIAIGLPHLPSCISHRHLLEGPAFANLAYTPCADAHDGGYGGNKPMACLLPKFQNLVESEMHVLLSHAQVHSTAWGQHMAQLSELLRSRSCPDGPELLLGQMDPKFAEFAEWVQADLQGEAAYAELSNIQARYSRDTKAMGCMD